MADLKNAPDISLDDDFTDSGEFLGVIVVDEWDQDKDGNWNWHIGLKPVDFDVQGETQLLHGRYRQSTRTNSKLGVLREAMQALPDVFPIGKGVKIGRGNYVGIVAWWTEKEISFGQNRQTGEEYKTAVRFPIRAADAEETKRAKAKVAGATGSTAAAPVPEADDTDISEHLDTIIQVVDGKTRAQIQMALGRDPGKTLPREIKSGLLSGGLLAKLVNDGLIEAGEGGKYRALVEV